MSADFTRTLQTASDAEGTARLLQRAAARTAGLDKERLAVLAGRYTEYAKALKLMVDEAAPADPNPDQQALAL